MIYRRYFERPLSLIVLLIGFLQIIGFILGIDGIRKIGQLTAASPLPLVFSHFRGLETFSPKFFIEYSTQEDTKRFAIDPISYSRFIGPYNRRNVYGAAFAYGAVLTTLDEQILVDPVLQYGLCPKGPLRQMLERMTDIKSTSVVRVVIIPEGSREEKVLSIECGEK